MLTTNLLIKGYHPFCEIKSHHDFQRIKHNNKAELSVGEGGREGGSSCYEHSLQDNGLDKKGWHLPASQPIHIY